MNDILVGKLEKNKNGLLSYQYDENWLKLAGARPISLSLPLINKIFQGDRVYNFFDNLLPDNSNIRNRIQAKFQVDTSQPFDLLAAIGRDCVGAIQLIPSELPYVENKMTFHKITDQQIAAILKNVKSYPLGMKSDSDEFRISIAGAQEKSAFLYWNKTWNRPVGTTPTTHIFKLPIGNIQHQNIDLSDSCENEWLCAQITEAFGLPIAKCEILYFEEVKVLVVERFDRKLSMDGKRLLRLPQEDICQALGISPNLKYQSDGGPGIESIMQLLLGSVNPLGDRDTFFRSQILFWLLAAIDGHAKNFSLHIETLGKYRLTPLYDIISAYPLIEKKQLSLKKIKMAMALKGKNNHYHWHNIQRRHFLSMAEIINYSSKRADELINEMLQKVDTVLQEVEAKLPIDFPSHISQPIFNGILFAKNRLLS